MQPMHSHSPVVSGAFKGSQDVGAAPICLFILGLWLGMGECSQSSHCSPMQMGMCSVFPLHSHT